MGGGNNSIDIGLADSEADDLAVNSGAGSDTVTIDTSAAQLETLTVSTGAGDDTLHVNNTHEGPTLVDFGAGDDTLNINNTQGVTEVHGGADDDQFNVIGYQGDVHLYGDDGFDQLAMELTGTPSATVTSVGIESVAIDDTSDGSSSSWQISGGTLRKNSQPVLSAADLIETNLALGDGVNTITVLDIDNQTTISAGDGDDEFIVGKQNPAANEARRTLSDIDAFLLLVGEGDNDKLTIHSIDSGTTEISNSDWKLGRVTESPINIWETGIGATTDISTGTDNDIIRVVGTRVGGLVNVDGGSPECAMVNGDSLCVAIDGGVLPGDTLQFDPQNQHPLDGLNFDYAQFGDPNLPELAPAPIPDGVIRVKPGAANPALCNNASHQDVCYASIEKVEILSASIAVIGALNPITEGDDLTLDASDSNTFAADSSTVSFRWDLDGDGAYDVSGATLTLSWSDLLEFGYDGDGLFHVTLRVDSEFGYNQTSATIEVINAAPTVSLSGDATVNEGSTYVLDILTSDPGPDTITTYIIDWGDGAIEPVGVPNGLTYIDDGSVEIVVDAVDEDGTYESIASKSVTVTDVAPNLTVFGEAISEEGEPYTLSLSSSDPGTDTITGWSVNWGDGQIVTYAGNPTSVVHTYDDDGAYIISAQATLDDNLTFNATTTSTPITFSSSDTPRDIDSVDLEYQGASVLTSTISVPSSAPAPPPISMMAEIHSSSRRGPPTKTAPLTPTRSRWKWPTYLPRSTCSASSPIIRSNVVP